VTEAERKPSPPCWMIGKAWTYGLRRHWRVAVESASRWRRQFATGRLARILPFQPMMPGTPERRTQSLRKHPYRAPSNTMAV